MTDRGAGKSSTHVLSSVSLPWFPRPCLSLSTPSLPLASAASPGPGSSGLDPSSYTHSDLSSPSPPPPQHTTDALRARTWSQPWATNEGLLMSPWAGRPFHLSAAFTVQTSREAEILPMGSFIQRVIMQDTAINKWC